MKNEFKLIEGIIKLSESKVWDSAKLEWKIIDNYYDEEYETCLCSHYPIKEILVIQNKINFNITIVGNCCIDKFFGIKSFNKFFKALSKNKINQLIIDTAFNKKIINTWEKDFLTDTWRKRILSEKQILKFNSLKEKIISNLKHEK